MRALLSLLAVPAFVASCASTPQVGEASEQAAGTPEARRTAAVPPKHPLAYYHFLLGYQAELNKDSERAIEEYLHALRRDPTSVFLKSRLASLYFSTGKLTEALRFADRVAESDVQDAQVLIDTAGIYAGAGKADQALALYDRAVEQRPHDVEAYFSKGVLLMNLKRYEEAERAFVLGNMQSKKNPVGHYYLGRIGLETKRLDFAIGHLEQAIAIRPTFEPAHVALASAYEAQENSAKAIEVYRRYLEEVSPGNKEIRQRLVKLYLRQQAYADALRLLEKSLSENPHDLDAQLRSSLIYGELKEYPKAIALLKQILAVQPGEVKVRDYLGLVYEESKDYEKALETYKTNVRLQPTYYDGRMHLGFLLYRLKRYPEAIPHLVEAVKLNPKKDEAHLLLGLTYLQSERYQEALLAFREGIRHNPSSPDLYFNLGTAYDKLDQFDEVVNAMETALRLDPEHADALNYLGYSYAERGIRVEEALALTQRAVSLKPNNGYYVDSLGWAFFKMGRLDDALKEIKRAVSLVEDDPVMYEHLGEIYFKQRLLEDAMNAWRRSLELDPHNDKLLERVRTRGLGDPTL